MNSHPASYWEHLPEINYLLEQEEINVNQQDNAGKTALHYACNDSGEKTFEGKTLFELIFQRKLANLELKVNMLFNSIAPNVYFCHCFP